MKMNWTATRGARGTNCSRPQRKYPSKVNAPYGNLDKPCCNGTTSSGCSNNDYIKSVSPSIFVGNWIQQMHPRASARWHTGSEAYQRTHNEHEQPTAQGSRIKASETCESLQAPQRRPRRGRGRRRRMWTLTPSPRAPWRAGRRAWCRRGTTALPGRRPSSCAGA